MTEFEFAELVDRYIQPVCSFKVEIPLYMMILCVP